LSLGLQKYKNQLTT